MTWQGRWEGRKRARDLSIMPQRVCNHARKCGSILHNDAAHDLSAALFARYEMLQERQAFFNKFRESFQDLCAAMSAEEVAILKDGPPEFVSQLVSTSVHKLVDRIVSLPKIAHKVVSVCSSDSNEKLTLKLLNISPMAIAHTQKNLVLAMGDRVSAISEPPLFVALGKELALALQGLVPLDPAEIDVSLDALAQRSGWFGQPLVDMNCIVVLASLVERGKEEEVDFELRRRCGQLLKSTSKISPRLKSFWRSSQAVVCKMGWDILASIKNTDDSRLEAAATVSLEDMEAVAQTLEDAQTMGCDQLDDVLVDLYNKHADALEIFGCVYSKCEGVGAMAPSTTDQNCFDLANRVRDGLLACIDLLLESWNCLSRWLNSGIVDGRLVIHEANNKNEAEERSEEHVVPADLELLHALCISSHNSRRKLTR